jgi:hypothetical protein
MNVAQSERNHEMTIPDTIGGKILLAAGLGLAFYYGLFILFGGVGLILLPTYIFDSAHAPADPLGVVLCMIRNTWWLQPVFVLIWVGILFEEESKRTRRRAPERNVGVRPASSRPVAGGTPRRHGW